MDDDPHRKPRDQDRGPLLKRIEAAAAAGLLNPPDRDIRVTNVRNAQSLTELSMIARDLDQLEAARRADAAPPIAFDPVTTAPAPGAVGFPDAPGGATLQHVVAASPARTGRTARVTGMGCLVAVVLLIAILGGGVALLAASSGDSDSGTSATSDGIVPNEEPSEEQPLDAEPEAPANPAYRLDRAGIETWLDTYRKRFGTRQVAGLTFYDEYVIVDVPVRGRDRQAGYTYRQDTGFTEFGPTRASFPGTRLVDTRRLDIAALMRNVRRATRTLEVENPSTVYVVIRHITQVDDRPRADIHVANEFRESGHLSTTLDGRVLRAFPYEAG